MSGTLAAADSRTVSTVRVRPAALRLFGSELRLLARDPFSVVFVVVFPIVTMLILGASFGSEPAHGFPVNPSHWYVASYFTVVVGAIGLVMLPVHIASYRERGVLRRFATAGFPRWSFAAAQVAVGSIAVAVGGGLLLAVATPVYGVPTPDQPLRVLAGVVASAAAFVGLGVLLGTLLPSARAAQAVGLLVFFPSFLLGVGGPPPSAMPDWLRALAERLPLAVANRAIREPWLGLGDAGGALAVTAALAVAVSVLACRRSAL